MREDVYNKYHIFQERVKNTFGRRAKVDDFQTQYLVLKWYARIQDKGKHGKFDHLWKGPYQIAAYHGKNDFTFVGNQWRSTQMRPSQWDIPQTLL